MIGAGVGITPLRALAEELGGRNDNGADVVLLHRYRDEPLFADELATLTRTAGLGPCRCRARTSTPSSPAAAPTR